MNNVSVLENVTNMMNCDHSTIVRHLHSMSKVQKSSVWLPQAISQNYKNMRLAICASLLARHRLSLEQRRPFLSCIVTGDKKWCLYANIRKRKEWLSPNKKQLPVQRPARIYKRSGGTTSVCCTTNCLAEV